MARVLIVDDQPDIRRLIRMTLEDEPFEVQEAANGEQALAAVASWRPDLILLDVMMPGRFDGLQVCASVRADPGSSDIRVVLLSARADSGDRAAGQAAGADEYLTKPFSPLQLLETIDRLLPGG
ncbi:response regulator transcription factor [Aquabacterium sp. OR-4]|uniref:response regulator transcription factor n=1 Tax=Aquabacterium sp. OR-4 TaxID=2978127 RepID=UPI0021B296E9|nr:response regulator [Aquabacterium sp. OR-4]MDT7834037.1 response regulator [Aquabacterium sp. OR-4]